jgi:molybdate transport system substrate-binding protein
MPAASAAEPLTVFAAGSLRAPMTALAAEFARADGVVVASVFGASGLLRDRIAQGERADVFASANMEHPESLAQRGWSGAPVAFARNQLCVLARPSIAIDSDNVLDVLLDRKIKVGTSTPKADPSGDYAWEVFRRAEQQRPGTFAALSAKAMQLTGGPNSSPPPANRNVYGVLVASGDADVFLTYCTNAALAVVEQPALRIVKLPPNLAVGATYGVVARREAPAAASAFVAHLVSPAGQRVLARYGFDPP